MTPITINDLTTAELDGTGVFDVLMRTAKAHLDQEYRLNRIKGPEYATVYLGALTAVMGQAMQFLLTKDKAANDAALIQAQTRLVEAQILKQAIDKALVDQQILNMQAEILNVPKQGALIDAQVDKVIKDISIADKEILIAEQKILVAMSEVAISEAKLINIPKEGALLDAQAIKLGKDQLLVTQQTLNAVTENLVLLATECKIKAEYDVLVLTKDKVVQETVLMAQKALTERAQTISVAAEPESVIGKQKALYHAQSAGYARDAEQKAAGVLVDAWKIQRTTNSDQIGGNVTNKLDDGNVGAAVAKLLSGVGL